MRRSAPTATTWYGIGVFSSWAACSTGSIALTTEPGRWQNEGGIFFSYVGSALMAILVSGTFKAWLSCRRATRQEGKPILDRFLLPLSLGIAHPSLVWGIAVCLEEIPSHDAASIGVFAAIFGGGVASGEVVVRFSRRVDDRGGGRAHVE